jgi:hypothetical protein
LISGCATLRRAINGDDPEAAASRLQELQLKVMRFADEYVGAVLEPARRFQLDTQNPSERLAAQNWKLSQATAAYTIASGPSAATNALDLVVLATLSRMVLEDTWVKDLYGERAEGLRDAHRRLEPQAWSLAAEFLSATQLQQLHGVIEEWRARNPHVRAVTYVHFRDFAQSIGQPKASELQTHGSLFALLGIDPLNSLDPAVRELTQTRQLAERTIYYAQRVPALLDMEVTRMTFELAVMPESRAVLADVNRASLALQAASSVVDQAPRLLAREREAAIHQFMQELASQQQGMRELLRELQDALAAGTVTSESLQGTLTGITLLVDRFKRPADQSPQAGQARRPFDITEYASAARELSGTAAHLESLLAQLDSTTPRVTALSDRVARNLRGLVSFTFWRLLALGVAQVIAVFAAVLIFRLVMRNIDTARERRLRH